MKTPKTVSFCDHLPVWHFDENLLVFNDGSFGQGFRLTGKDISATLEQVIDEFSQNVENLINTAAEGLKLQVFYKLSSEVDPFIKAHEDLSIGCSDVYKSIAQSRQKFINENKESGNYFQPQIFFFIRSNGYKYGKQKLWDSDAKFKQISDDEYREHKNKFLRNVTQLKSSLEFAGLSPKELAEIEWHKEIFEYFNFERAEKFGVPKLRPLESEFNESLANQINLSDVEIHKNHLQIDNLYFRVLTLKLMPDDTHPSLIDTLLKLPFHFWLSQNIQILDQKDEYSKLQMKRRLTHSMAAGSTTVSDLESESKLSHIENLLNEVIESNEKIVSSDLNVIIWANDLEDLENKSDEVLRAFKTMNQAEGISESYPLFDAFIKTAPGFCEGLRMKKMKTSNVAHLSPLFSYWQGNKNSPVCLVSNRDNVLVGVDLFDPNLPNWNGLVIGSSGAGKSFTLSQLVLMFYGQTPSPKIVWLDNGASSKNVIDCLDGQFVELKLDSGICLNPFDLEEGQKAPGPSKIKLILAVIENICKEDDETGLPKRQKALLEEAIIRSYQNCDGTPTLSDFRKLLIEHPSQEMKAYADILFSWTGNSAFGKLLDGKTNIQLKKDLVTIEMKELGNHPELENIFLLLLTEFIQREASSNPVQKYLLIIDEAWKLLQSKSGAQFTVEAYRTFRKFNAGIWAISQNINDFRMQKDVSNAILQNTPSRIILRQRGVDWKDFQDVLSLNDAEIGAIKTLKQVKGKYSEIYYIQDDNKSILRIEPDPISYWICTTDPKDKALIESIKKENPNLSYLEVLKLASEKGGSYYKN